MNGLRKEATQGIGVVLTAKNTDSATQMTINYQETEKSLMNTIEEHKNAITRMTYELVQTSTVRIRLAKRLDR